MDEFYEQRMEATARSVKRFWRNWLIASLIILSIFFVPYLIYHLWPWDPTSTITRFNENAPITLTIAGCYISPAGMIIGAAGVVVYLFSRRDFIKLFELRRRWYIVMAVLLTAAAMVICIFLPAWVYAVLLPALLIPDVIAILGLTGKFEDKW